VSIDDPVEEYEAPVLFISGADAWTPTDAQVDRLRAYVARGGTILAEPSDHAKPFAQAMEALAGRLFPSSPLAPVASSHGVYTVLNQDWKDATRPALRGVEHGGRTVFFVSDAYLSGDWQRNDLESDAFRLAMNILFYATDRATARGRFATAIPDAPAAEARGEMAVGVIGQGIDPVASWSAAAPWLQHVTGVKVQAKAATSKDLSAFRLVHFSGRGATAMSASDEGALRAFVAQGGTLCVFRPTRSPGSPIALTRSSRSERSDGEQLSVVGNLQVPE
jgi:hypothetical protein